MSPKDDGVSEIDVKRFEVGSGIKHAIIWISIISSFAAGWYIRGQFTEGELAAADLFILKQDIIEKIESREERDARQENLDVKLEGKTYDKDCGDRSLGDFYK